MPIFGQVWLWSLLAFLLGALLCWVLVVLPIRKRIVALERRLASARSETKQAPPVAAPAAPAERRPEPLSTPSSIVPGFGEPDPHDEIRAESLTRAYALPGIPDPNAAPENPEERGALRLSPDQPAAPAPPPAEVTEYIGSHSSQGWFEDEAAAPPAPRGEHNLVDDEDDEEDRGTIFTQRTMPIPVEAIRRLDEAGRAEAPPAYAPPAHAAPEPASARDDSLVDDLEDEPVEEPAAEQPPVFAGADTVVVRKNGTPQPEPEPEPTPEPVAQDRSEERIALVANNKNTMRTPIIELNKPLELDRQQSSLPKRIPSKPQHRAPFGVQTVSPAVSAPVAAATTAPADTGAERMRSLFEPVIPAESAGGQQNAVLPPPHRLQHTESRANAPGPFGPGSAMPLPGGASPAPEFTVKASVTALRYCTQDSPQFSKTVAEVWFRTAADAERVGFRPVG